MAEQKRTEQPEEPQITQENEGEGSRTAARHYDEATEEFIREGKVEPAARAAREAIEGPEAEALRRAEQEGKRPLERDIEIEDED